MKKLGLNRWRAGSVAAALLLGGGVANADPITTYNDVANVLGTYNLLTFGDFGAPSVAGVSSAFAGDVGGPIAVGGNAYLNSFNADTANVHPGGANALTVAGTLNFASTPTYDSGNPVYGGGSINGNAFAGNGAFIGSTVGGSGGLGQTGSMTVNGNLSIYNSGIGGTLSVSGAITTNGSYGAGSVVNPAPAAADPVNFSQLGTGMNAASAALAGLGGTSGVQVGNMLTLTGANNVLNVFSIDPSVLAGLTQLTILIPDGAHAVINIVGGGSNVDFGNLGSGIGLFCGVNQCTAAQGENIIFNVVDAPELFMDQVSFDASLLAPDTELDLVNAQIVGSAIVGSAIGPIDDTQGQSEFDWAGADRIPEPGSLLLLGVALAGLGALRRRARPA